MSLRPYFKALVISLVLATIFTVGFAQEAGHAAKASSSFSKEFAVGVACLGVALGVGFVGAAAANAVGRNPGASGEILKIGIISMAMVEAIAFYVLFLL